MDHPGGRGDGITWISELASLKSTPVGNSGALRHQLPRVVTSVAIPVRPWCLRICLHLRDRRKRGIDFLLVARSNYLNRPIGGLGDAMYSLGTAECRVDERRDLDSFGCQFEKQAQTLR